MFWRNTKHRTRGPNVPPSGAVDPAAATSAPLPPPQRPMGPRTAARVPSAASASAPMPTGGGGGGAPEQQQPQQQQQQQRTTFVQGAHASERENGTKRRLYAPGNFSRQRQISQATDASRAVTTEWSLASGQTHSSSLEEQGARYRPSVSSAAPIGGDPLTEGRTQSYGHSHSHAHSPLGHGPASQSSQPLLGTNGTGTQSDEATSLVSPSQSAETQSSNPYMISHVMGLYQDTSPEEDDWLHEVEKVWNKDRTSARYKNIDKRGSCLKSFRGFANMCILIGIFTSVAMLFLGYPIIVALMRKPDSTKGAHGLGGTNLTGQVPDFGHIRTSLIDPATPMDKRSKMSWDGKKKMNLVFSDEFETDGRSFYKDHDPFWEAEDLHYWQTGNYEWYDPAAITTKDGKLVITFDEHRTHNMNFRSGMLTSWNKFCFSGGRLEVSAVLPGNNVTMGYWPAVWMMGNLGRAGYGATTQGMWPYLYDSCDVGTLPNQTWPAEKGGGPEAAETGGPGHSSLSWLPGQKLSACTCPGMDHPGPVLPDGSFKGRNAPELDLFEASVWKDGNGLSLSLQSAPFTHEHKFDSNASGAAIFVANKSFVNTFTGGFYQQSYSGISKMAQDAFEENGARFTDFAVEWKGGKGPDSYVTWLTEGDKLAWHLSHKPLEADPLTEIGPRAFPEEPMYIIMNVGMAYDFAAPDWKHLKWPRHMYIDWVRVYQPEGEENVGCDPPDFPTKKYIERHRKAYYDANVTSWIKAPEDGGYGSTFPRNRLLQDC